MQDLLNFLLSVGAISSFRHDDTVSRQGIMNHQTTCHLQDLLFARDACEMSIPESYAIQGLAAAHLPRDAAGMNLASQTPK